jgi:hypothetical protein
MRTDDLRGVFKLGVELFAKLQHEVMAPWYEKALAEILADSMELSLVAVRRKKPVGLLITSAPISGRDSGFVEIKWLGARGPERYRVMADLLSSLYQMLAQRNIEAIRIQVPGSDSKLIAFLEKFGFTEKEHSLIMENFLPKI